MVPLVDEWGQQTKLSFLLLGVQWLYQNGRLGQPGRQYARPTGNRPEFIQPEAD
jgi:hypothetical protein